MPSRGYELAEVIGEGSFGAVYRAVQPSVGREVAVKLIRPELADTSGVHPPLRGRGPPGRPARAPAHRAPLRLLARTRRRLPGVPPGCGAGAGGPGRRRVAGRWRHLRLVEEIGGALSHAHARGRPPRREAGQRPLRRDGNFFLGRLRDRRSMGHVGDARDRAVRRLAALRHPEQLRRRRRSHRRGSVRPGHCAWEALTGRLPFPGLDACPRSAGCKFVDAIPSLDARGRSPTPSTPCCSGPPPITPRTGSPRRASSSRRAPRPAGAGPVTTGTGAGGRPGRRCRDRDQRPTGEPLQGPAGVHRGRRRRLRRSGRAW